MNMAKTQKYIDLHMDMALYLRGEKPLQVTLPMIQNRLSAFLASVFVPPEIKGQENILQETRKQINWYKRLQTKNKGQDFRVVLSKKDFALLEKSVRLVIHLEGLNALNPSTLSYLTKWRNAGVRSAGLLWNNDNAIGTSSASNRSNEGLSSFGRRVVATLDRLSILIDCAHLNKAGFYDILRFSSRPPFVSHGNAYVLCPHPRNYTDKQIRDIGKAGGVIGVFFSGRFVKEKGTPTIHDVVNHIEHIINIGGENCVAIGSDFGGITGKLVKKLSSVKDMSHLITECQRRGFTKEEIEKILWKNAERYLESNLP